MAKDQCLRLEVWRVAPQRAHWRNNDIREVPGSNLGLNIVCADRGVPFFSSAPASNFEIVFRLDHDFFLPSRFQFINHRFIRRYTGRNDGVEKQKQVTKHTHGVTAVAHSFCCFPYILYWWHFVKPNTDDARICNVPPHALKHTL
jgi:hypothetical protein